MGFGSRQNCVVNYLGRRRTFRQGTQLDQADLVRKDLILLLTDLSFRVPIG